MNNLFSLACQCLEEAAVESKIGKTRELSARIITGDVSLSPQPMSAINPGRPAKPELVAPQLLPKRKLTTAEGRAAMVHSFAHIEFNAINLALDIMCRFQAMPLRFYQDWARVANEEARHFDLLNQRLIQLGYTYGDFQAHDGLWQMAADTAHDILLRLAVVPRILEARGLDVTPNLINRFMEIKDSETASILQLIYQDEIGHVEVGSRWFRHVCDERQIDPEDTFSEIFRSFAPRGKNKLNRDARLQAGFSHAELESITGMI